MICHVISKLNEKHLEGCCWYALKNYYRRIINIYAGREEEEKKWCQAYAIIDHKYRPIHAKESVLVNFGNF